MAPHFVIVMGGSGSGKNHFISHNSKYSSFKLIDVDAMRADLSTNISSIKPALMEAMKLGVDIAHPTTGAGNLAAITNKFKMAKDFGYDTTLILIDTPAEISMKNVKKRFSAGGHDVPAWKIQKTNEEARKNFDLASESQFVDNSEVVSNNVSESLRLYVMSVLLEMSQEDVATSKDPLDWFTAAYQSPEEWGASDEFEAMLIAADKLNLKVVGTGSSRLVFDLKNNRVVKIARNNKGIEQNKLEASAGRDPQVERILASVWEFADDFSWVVADKVEPLEDGDGARAEKIVGISWNELRDLVNAGANRENAVTSVEGGETKTKKSVEKGTAGCLKGDSFLSSVDYFMTRYEGLLPGDIAKLSSWGVTEQGCLVLLDYGITIKKFRELYK
jgi:predicted ABC-type ATPase